MSPKRNSPNINPNKYGISLSSKQCRNFGLNPEETLNWLLDQGFRRFRLMSYWDEHETAPGTYDFKSLDRQVAVITKAGGVITMCLGARQPRWPENHWPDWAWDLPKDKRSQALLNYVEQTVMRFKKHKSIISWQLENEALLKEFGERPEIDRKRLREEFALVKRLDPRRDCIMTTSTSWGIPFRKPIPDIIGFSFYQIVYNQGKYTTSFHKAWLDRLRSISVRLLHGRQSFIHELQAEPWGPRNIWEMSAIEQDRSMNVDQLAKNIDYAQATRLFPIDLWGGEWWYWCSLQGDKSKMERILSCISAS